MPAGRFQDPDRTISGMISLLFILMALSMGPASGCSSDGGDAPDGDAEMEADTEGCLENAVDCQGAVALVCLEGVWRTAADCSETGRVCVDGHCKEPVGGDEDADDEKETDVEEEAEDDGGDRQPPRIVDTVPSDGETDLPTTLDLVLISFDEPVESNGFVFGRDVSIQAGGTNILFSGVFRSEFKQMRLELLTTLPKGSTCTVTLAPDTLQDAAGNLFAGDEFSFHIEGQADGDSDGDIDGDGDGEEIPDGDSDADTEPDDSLPDGDADPDADVDTWVNGGFLDGYRLTDCKADPGTFTPDSHPPSAAAVWNAEGSFVQVTHVNAVLDRCGSVQPYLLQDRTALNLYEIYPPTPSCGEECPRDIEMDIRFLLPETYTVNVHPCPEEVACESLPTVNVQVP